MQRPRGPLGEDLVANFTFFNLGVDMTNIDITGYAGGGVISSSSTELDFQDSTGHAELDIHGKNFGDFDVNGIPHVGTILGMDAYVFGNQVADFSKLHMDVGVFDTYLANNDSQGLAEALLVGNDHITGSSQADTLTGLKGRDAIDGSGGNDILIGGAGGDSLTGGAGNDTFLYQATGDSGKKGVDTIMDLSTGDAIDLSAIDADTHTAGDQAFHIVAKLKGHAGEMTVVYDAAHDRTIISLDTNGDGKADGIIWASGDHHAFSGWVL
jgi:Ca2+-binding RTX toxin-like protein